MQQLPTKEVAFFFGTSKTSINRWMEKYGLKNEEGLTTKKGNTSVHSPTCLRRLIAGRKEDFLPRNKIISFANLKGGVGKTTTCVHTGKTLAALGIKTLIIDADKQANATSSLIGAPGAHCLLDVIKGVVPIKQAILNVDENLDLLPSNLMNARLDSETNNPALNITKYIKTFLQELDYEYILIDTEPSLSRINSFIIGASDLVVAPVLLDEYSITGLRLINDTINSINQNFSASVTVRSLVNRYDNRMTSSLDILTDLKETGVRPFVSIIKTSTDYTKAQASGDIPVSSNAKRDFLKFAAELIGIEPENPEMIQ